MPLTNLGDDDPIDPNAFRVLITGFGPSLQHKDNPSWLAVKPLHNVVITEDASSSHINGDQPSALKYHTIGERRPIHITCLQIPCSYEAILRTVPSLHTRFPVLRAPPAKSGQSSNESGYDLVFHVGVAGRGPLRMERTGHKVGYHMKDADGKLAPIVHSSHKDFSRRSPDDPLTGGLNSERERLGLEMGGELVGSDSLVRPLRGFGKDYEMFGEELATEIDVTRLVQYLKRSGIEIYTSMDAGHYICDYIYYCSLAEAKRTVDPYEKRRHTQVLFLHCPPVNQPLGTEEVTDAIRRIVIWICAEMQLADYMCDTPGGSGA